MAGPKGRVNSCNMDPKIKHKMKLEGQKYPLILAHLCLGNTSRRIPYA